MKSEVSDYTVQSEILGSNVLYAEDGIARFNGRRINSFLSKSELRFLNGELECDRNYQYVLVHRLKKKIQTLGQTLDLLMHNNHTWEYMLETLQKTVSLTDFSKIERSWGLSNERIENSQIGVNSGNKSKTGLSVCSGSIARLSIPAFRAGDPGSNPGRSTKITTHIDVIQIACAKHRFVWNINFKFD